jgi:hypothetical protein
MAITTEHIDKNTFKQIFRDYWEDFRAAHPRYATGYHSEMVQKMLDCGDPDRMGFAQFRCLGCGETRRVAFTCKSCFCLPCGKVYADRWVEFIGRRLFGGVTYRHIVLTMPEKLRLWFYRHPALLSDLMRAGHACLVDTFSALRKTPLDIGSAIILQTAGRPGNYNPHLHILLTAGGVDERGNWKPVSYLPYDLLHRKWQYHLLTLMRKVIADPEVEKDIEWAWKTYPNGFVAYVQPGQVPPGGQGLAQYLAKYVVSPPISVRRIVNYDGKTVHYWYRDHQTGQIEHETLDALRFIGRMVQHILPKGFQRIRYYGLHANVRDAQVRPILERIKPSRMPPDPHGFRVRPRKSFAQTFFDTFGKDPLDCPRCGKAMTLELIHHPRYGTIKSYLTFEEIADEQPTDRTRPGGLAHPRPVERPQHLVQVSLPFL